MKKEFTTKALMGIAATLLVGSMGAAAMGAGQKTMSPEEAALNKQLTLFYNVLGAVQRSSVEEHSYRELAETALTAMVKLADPNATYMNKLSAEMENSLSPKDRLLYQTDVAFFVMQSAKSLAERNNVPGVTYEKLVETGLKATLKALDPHSSFYGPAEWKKLNEEMKGEFGGVGISLTTDENDNIKALDIIENTPAARAGIQKEDIITKINGESTKGLDINAVVDRMRGKPQTEVQITVARKGEPNAVNFTLTREVIRVDLVKSRMIETGNGRIGYVQILQFGEKVDSKVDAAIQSLKNDKDGAPSAYIVDVRNNPGGLLDQVADIADNFLEEGDIASTRVRGGKVYGMPYTAHSGDDIDGKPLVILTNAGSASASEILASTLKHNRPYLGNKGRATIIGEDETTFGKGSVQSHMGLEQLGGGGMHLTIALYYAPEKTPQNVGVTPDIKVILPPPSAEDLKKRDEWFKKNSSKMTPEQREEFLHEKDRKDTQTSESLRKGTLKDRAGKTRDMDLATKVCELKDKEPPAAEKVNKSLLNSVGKLDVALSCAVDFLQSTANLTSIKDRPATAVQKAAPAPTPES